VLWDAGELAPRSIPIGAWLREDLRTQGFSEADLQLSVRPHRTPEAARAAVRELIGEHVTAIWASNAVGAREAKAETATIPIVFGAAADPVRDKLVDRVDQPGGNVTGVAVRDDGPGRRLELLKELAPSLRRVLTTPYPPLPGTQRWSDELLGAARRLDVTLVEYRITGARHIRELPHVLSQYQVDGVVYLANPFLFQHWEAAWKIMQEARLPDMGFYGPDVERGWMVAAYAVDLREAWRQSAAVLARILRGARPGDTAVESSARVELTINVRVAHERGLQVPQAVLLRADKLLE
jgi:putative ABC transport system substrate-binding protein